MLFPGSVTQLVVTGPTLNNGDLVALAQNYGTALPAPAIGGAPAAFSDDWARAMSEVPEPATVSLLLLACVTTTRRRRRR